MKKSWLPRVLFSSLFALVACSGGSGGCGGCSTLTPIAGGFPQDKRIDNAASIRLTEGGFGFLKDNIGALAGNLLSAGNGLSITIPATTASGIDVCQNVDPAVDPSYECKANIQVQGLHLDSLQTAAPNQVVLSGTIPIQVESLPINVPVIGGLRVFFDPGTATECTDLHHDAVNVPISVTIAVERVDDASVPSRNGLSRISVVDLTPTIDDDTIHIVDRIASDSTIACLLFGGAPCCPKGFVTDSSVVSFVKGLLIGQFTGPLTDQVKSALCTAPSADAPCPTGTHEDSNKCLFDDDDTQCASTVIGIDGTVNVGGLLASVSPATKGALDIQLAAGGKSNDPVETAFKLGDLYPKNNGATLAMSGGAEPHPDPNLPLCGPPAQVPLPTNVPTPIELFGNDGPSTWDASPDGPNKGAPHIGIGVSEKYLNYAFASIYNSGALCLQVDSSLNDLLSTSTFAVIIPSLKSLQPQNDGDNKGNAPVGIVINPSKPPTAKVGKGIGTEPTLDVALNGVAMDFYVFSMDRYVRVFTLNTDIGIPINIEVGPDGGLLPVIGGLNLTNTSLSNNSIIQEDPDTVANGLKTVIGSAVGGLLGGAIPAINLNSTLSSLGIQLIIPPTTKDADGVSLGSPGVTRIPFEDAAVTENNRFLGIFARLCVAGGADCPATASTSALTSATLISKNVDPAGMVVTTMNAKNRPVVQMGLASKLEAQGLPIEYSYRIDSGMWHPYISAKVVDIGGEIANIQGVHVVEARSRFAGKGYSPDVVPARLEVRFDIEAPVVKTEKQDGVTRVVAFDSVSKRGDLVGRLIVAGAVRTDWINVADLPPITSDLGDDYNVEVRDEEGNVGQLREPLRGRVDKTGQPASSGCGCSVPGQENSNGPGSFGLFGLVAAMGVVASRWSARRKRLAEAVAGVAVMSVAGSWAGCNCSSDDAVKSQPTAGTAGSGGQGGTGGAPYECKAEDDCFSLEQGLIGAYTSADATTDGTIWVAGYNDSAYDTDNGDFEYGDLVVGKYDASGDKVTWETVDGLPDGDPDGTSYDLNGWRGGQSDPGDNVGFWTSLKIGTGDKPMVAYHDRTNGKLKFASKSGDKWAVHIVDTQTDSVVGEYAKMLVIDGKPVIVYLSRELQEDGSVTSKIKIARGTSAIPSKGGDWTIEEDPALTFATGGCDVSLCKTGTRCSKVSRKCQEPVDGCMDCTGTTKACLADPDTSTPTCTAIQGNSSPVGYPDATGLYISIAKDDTDVGIVFYDRVRGNLHAARKASGAWAVTLLDGQGADNLDTGDVGIGASLVIDGADWYISYVDGITEALRFMKWSGGEPPASEIVDIGASLDPNDTGRHIVGDDSSISESGGIVTVAYQDATAGTLRTAKRDATGTWGTPTIVTQDGKTAGFFSVQVQGSSGVKLGNWWRKTEPKKIYGDVGFVTVP